MKKILKRVGIGFAGFTGFAFLGLYGYIEFNHEQKFDAPYPEITASTDPTVIEHGKYLVFGPAHCSYCHTQLDKHTLLDEGAYLPLTGGMHWNLPVGTMRSPNITPCEKTGIGRYSDEELARMLRYGVRPDGKIIFPMMEFPYLSDEDLTAIVSYLRSQEPVEIEREKSSLNLIGKAVSAFVLKPVGPTKEVLVKNPSDEDLVRKGEYLANSVAGCVNCHTERNMMDGSYIGPKYAGGMALDSDLNNEYEYVSPNITPDKETGIGKWTEEQFIQRFRIGKTFPDTHMPWAAYNRMSDEDLAAIYQYLLSLEPVSSDVGPVYRKKNS